MIVTDHIISDQRTRQSAVTTIPAVWAGLLLNQQHKCGDKVGNLNRLLLNQQHKCGNKVGKIN